jgi:hypothetical protein
MAGALALLASLSSGGCTDHREPPADDDPADTPARTGGASDRRGAADAPTCAWIPADAREVTPVASMRADTANDPLCFENASMFDIPKSVAVAIERELRESTKISDAEEARIGAHLERALPRERDFAGKLDLPADVQRYKGYLTDIVQSLASRSTRPQIKYRIHTVRSPMFNAAALPGGVLLVFTGTLEGKDAVRDEAELAGVLAHEITHVERRHVVAAYQFARAALGDDSDEAVLAMRILSQPLSTEHELEADERGMELATLAGYDPQAVVNLWRRHASHERGERHGPRRGRPRDRDVVDDVIDGVEGLLRSHPPAAVRACHAMEKLAWVRENAPCDRLYDGRTNLRTHVAGARHPY